MVERARAMGARAFDVHNAGVRQDGMTKQSVGIPGPLLMLCQKVNFGRFAHRALPCFASNFHYLMSLLASVTTSASVSASAQACSRPSKTAGGSPEGFPRSAS